MEIEKLYLSLDIEIQTYPRHLTTKFKLLYEIGNCLLDMQ